jgi:nicotinamide phosphoribosyltransferase
MNNIILNTDSYKASHFLQYPAKTEFVSSYIEARGGKMEKVLFFGLQVFIKSYLCTPFSQEDIDEAEAIITAHGLPFYREGWEYILDTYNGFLPLEISAIEEGRIVPLQTAMVQVINTDPKCYWLTSYIETALLRAIWYPTTVATLSYSIKQTIQRYLDETSDDTFADFKLHDFGSRGVSSEESAMLGGMAHLVNFQGSDTLSAVVGARRYYNADMAAFSIPASEHSTITSWGRKGEEDAYNNMITQFGKEGKIFAVVSDSYDIYNAVSHIWGEKLKDKLKSSGATLVIRPDSGKPQEVVLEVMKRVYEKFGGTINSKGYKVLDSSVRIIQGDGVNADSIKEILEILKNNGFAAENIAFGMGGALLQQPNRDTLSFAMKASAICIDGEWRDVYKDPITDSGKRSKRGRLAVTNELETIRVEELGDETNLLQPIYRNGELLKELDFDTIRANAKL